MENATLNIVLADDDADDCELFEAALKELTITTNLTIVNNGKQLIDLLNDSEILPDLLFLDINMPLKNGIECLIEIKKTPKLHPLCVVIFSTTISKSVLNTLYNYGAQYYFCKPDLFSELTELLQRVITLASQTCHYEEVGGNSQPSREDFIL